ncbi:hypothetical protein [Noviherbaspirillum sp.]|uniref:hypothetical protein n=1 Tax=Noviherbaspirillum sp. TaxID=1926288 RepID=UPI002FE089F2
MHLLLLALLLVLLKPAMSNNSSCIERFISQQTLDVTQLPAIEYRPGSAWFKAGATILEAPSHDYQYVHRNSPFANSTQIYFFDLKHSQGYIQQRGGLVDKVRWFGPFTVDNELHACVTSLLKSPSNLQTN